MWCLVLISFQGYHDIITVLFLTLPPALHLPCAEQLSLHRVRDSMGSSLEPVLGLLRYVSPQSNRGSHIQIEMPASSKIFCDLRIPALPRFLKGAIHPLDWRTPSELADNVMPETRLCRSTPSPTSSPSSRTTCPRSRSSNTSLTIYYVDLRSAPSTSVQLYVSSLLIATWRLK